MRLHLFLLFTFVLFLSESALAVIFSGHLGNIGDRPLLSFTGTHAECGAAVGKTFGPMISEYFSKEPELVKRLREFRKNHGDIFDSYRSAVKSRYPRITQETEALGAAMGWDEDFTWLVQFQFEINNFNKSGPVLDPRLEHCSDIHITNENGETLSAHNEDGGANVATTGYFLNLTFTDAIPEVEASNIFGFAYPGALLGNAFTWTRHLTVTNNALFPKVILPDGVPRNFANRDAVRAKTVKDCIARSTIHIASGFNLNVQGKYGDGIMDVEVGPSGVNAEVSTPRGTASPHFNMYLYMTSLPQRTDPSSLARMERFKEFPSPKSSHDVRMILGDTKNKEYPLYRNGAPPDTGVVTLATVVFDSINKKTMLWANSSPKETEPDAVFPLHLE